MLALSLDQYNQSAAQVSDRSTFSKPAGWSTISKSAATTAVQGGYIAVQGGYIPVQGGYIPVQALSIGLREVHALSLGVQAEQ